MNRDYNSFWNCVIIALVVTTRALAFAAADKLRQEYADDCFSEANCVGEEDAMANLTQSLGAGSS